MLLPDVVAVAVAVAVVVVEVVVSPQIPFNLYHQPLKTNIQTMQSVPTTNTTANEILQFTWQVAVEEEQIIIDLNINTLEEMLIMGKS